MDGLVSALIQSGRRCVQHVHPLGRAIVDSDSAWVTSVYVGSR